jgi:hypothetical protein
MSVKKPSMEKQENETSEKEDTKNIEVKPLENAEDSKVEVASSDEMDDSKLLEMFIVENPTDIVVKDIPNKKDLLTFSENIILSKKALKQVVAMQSAYVAKVSALSLAEMYSLRNSELSIYEDKLMLCKTVYSHIEETSLGYMKFDEFLNLTSYYDLDTLLFGIYCRTYPEINKFPAECPACKVRNELLIDNEDFIITKDEDTYKDLLKILKSEKTEDLIKQSLVRTKDRILMNDSKIIIDIYIPTLKDYLDVLQTIDPKELTANEEMFSIFLNISEIYVPNMVDIKKIKMKIDSFVKV